MHTSSISNIHLRFHEILDFSAFLDVFRTYWIVSPPSSNVSIVPDVYGRQLVGRDEVGHYPEDQTPDEPLAPFVIRAQGCYRRKQPNAVIALGYNACQETYCTQSID